MHVSWCATLSRTYLSEFFGVDGENIIIHVYAPKDFLVLCFRVFFFVLNEPTLTMSVLLI